MNTLNEKEIQDLLTPRERPVPPADLAERIKREIPEDLPAVPGLDDDLARRRLSTSRVWLMAASVAVAVGGGFLALRLMDQVPAPGESPAPTADAHSTAAPPAGESAVSGVTRGVPETAAESTPGEMAEVPAEFGATSRDTTRGDAAKDRKADGTLDPAARQARAETAAPRAVAEDDADARRTSAAPSTASAREPAQQPIDDEAALRERQERHHELNKLADARRQNVDAEELRRRPPPAPPASAAPSPSPRAKKVPTSEDELREREVGGNASIAQENAMYSQMHEEARRLEAQLRALEEAPHRRPAPSAPPSTGGTAEPNDAPYGDVFFDSAGTNPFIDTEDDALSTYGLDVDTGSYTVVRRYLEDGHLPPPDAVRVEEFINYFDYRDAPPEKAEFAIHAEGAPSIYGESERYHLLRFNLSGREIDDSDRRPAVLTFVVDVSGSMGRENRLGLVKQALALLIDQLHADDRLALVIYGSRGQVVLEPTGDHGAIRRAIDRLQTSGSTNAEEGLALAYELAARHRRRGAINRVILCSDGVANVGATSAGSILERIRREANQGIELTTVGFGMGNYNDTLMEQLADTGNGRYAYVDTLEEARRVFVENLTGTLQTLAAEARVQVDFNPETVARYRLLGYENRDIADHRFRDDTVVAGELGVGHRVTALYEIKLHRELSARDRVATLRLRYGSIDGGKIVEVERAVTGADFVSRWDAASPALKLTSLVAEYAEILKRTYWAKEGDLGDVFRRAQRLSAEFAGDRGVADFVSLVGRAAEYRKREQR